MKELPEDNLDFIKPFENQRGEDLTGARNDSDMSPEEKADALRSQLALRRLDPQPSADRHL